MTYLEDTCIKVMAVNEINYKVKSDLQTKHRPIIALSYLRLTVADKE